VKFRLKTAISGLAAAAVVGGGMLAMASSAAYAAQTAPSWEPDADSAAPYGNIAFYDANGVQVTSGTNLAAPFAYAAGTTAHDSGATKATMYFAIDGSNGSALPSGWTQTQETASNTFSPAPSGEPADLASLTAPVDNASAANITSFLGGITLPTGQYANTIQVRITDSGTGGSSAIGMYWSADIGFNTTASPITVDGTTVPANGWAQLFPFTNAPATATSLAISPTGSHQLNGTALTLSATTAASPTLPGYVVFENNGAVIGDVAANTAGATTLTYTPAANSTNSFTASFVPMPIAETGAQSASAAQTTSSTSAAQAVTYSPPQTGTTTTLGANPTSITYGASVALTSTASAADTTTPAGTVEFLTGSTPITGCTAVAINTGGTASSAVCNTTSLPQGSDSVTAVFTPTSNTYATSTSSAVTVTVAAPAACSLTGSSCSDTQNITVTVNPGTITITTPYTAANPFVLPAMTLSSDGTYLSSSATFPATTLPNTQQIVVTSQLAPAYAWTLSVSATNLSDGSGGTIASSGLGLTNGALLNGGTAAGDFSGTVTFTNIAAHNPSPQDTDTNIGLTASPQTWAHTTAADGTAEMNGTLTLLAPTTTPPGTYTGTVTFSVS
jgi:hypothetical protein